MELDFAPHRIGQEIEWENLKPFVDTGDILLCQNTKSEFGKIEELATNAPYTHVAMFVWMKETLVVFESAWDKDYPDFETGKTDGPKMVEADYYISMSIEADATILTYRPLRSKPRDLPYEFTKFTYQRTQIIMQYARKREVLYERDYPELLNALLRYESSDMSSLNYFFCSELVASMYIAMGLPMARSPMEYKPADFGTGWEDVFDIEKESLVPYVYYLGVEQTIVCQTRKNCPLK